MESEEHAMAFLFWLTFMPVCMIIVYSIHKSCIEEGKGGIPFLQELLVEIDNNLGTNLTPISPRRRRSAAKETEQSREEKETSLEPLRLAKTSSQPDHKQEKFSADKHEPKAENKGNDSNVSQEMKRRRKHEKPRRLDKKDTGHKDSVSMGSSIGAPAPDELPADEAIKEFLRSQRKKRSKSSHSRKRSKMNKKKNVEKITGSDSAETAIVSRPVNDSMIKTCGKMENSDKASSPRKSSQTGKRDKSISKAKKGTKKYLNVHKSKTSGRRKTDKKKQSKKGKKDKKSKSRSFANLFKKRAPQNEDNDQL